MLVLAAAALVGVLIARGIAADHTDSAVPKPQPVDSVLTPQAGVLSAVLSGQNGSAVVGYCAGSSALPEVAGPVTVFTPVPGGTGGMRLEISRPDAAPCTHSAATCPGADAGRSECATTDVVSAAVVDAVGRRYPEATLALASTETIRATGALWYRLLVFELPGARTLRVDVLRRAVSHASSGQFASSVFRVVRAVHTHGAVATMATIAGPDTPRPDTGTLDDLTDDPVLTTAH